jgi:hypothetical protein
MIIADNVLKWAEYQTEKHRKALQQLVATLQTRRPGIVGSVMGRTMLHHDR